MPQFPQNWFPRLVGLPQFEQVLLILVVSFFIFESKLFTLEELSLKYEPRVFYYDQIREFNSLSYINYKAYKEFLANLEDIVYNRFSKSLANNLKKSYDNAEFCMLSPPLIIESTSLR